MTDETKRMQEKLVALALEQTFPALCQEVVIEENRITVMNAIATWRNAIVYLHQNAPVQCLLQPASHLKGMLEGVPGGPSHAHGYEGGPPQHA